jgi:hypothetical protein
MSFKHACLIFVAIIFVTAWLIRSDWMKLDKQFAESPKIASPKLHRAVAKPPKPAKSEAELSWDACQVAHRYIQNALKAPSTAEFPGCYSSDPAVSTWPHGNGTFTVNTYVDAQNSFGAKLREYYICRVYFPGTPQLMLRCFETDRDHTQTLNTF